MKSLGIIAEYNPFHKGHLYHISKSKELTDAEIVICVISGNFTQRGEMAILNKWARAEMALKNGANLVLEMPAVFACNSGGYFGKAGTEILEALGVDYLSFGSESGDIDKLLNISNCLTYRETEIEDRIRIMVKDGLSYPRAREEALKGMIGQESLNEIASPNNILALEYLKNIKNLKPLTVTRLGEGYNETDAVEGFKSAKHIREKLKFRSDLSLDEMEDMLPFESLHILEEYKFQISSNEKIFKYLTFQILSKTNEELNNILGGKEGLGDKLKNIVRKVNSYEELIEGLKSKRYTRTGVSRYLAAVLLNIQGEHIRSAKNYIRVLGFDHLGSKFLKEVKKRDNCELPIITNINKEAHKYPEIIDTLNVDIKATDIYNLINGLDKYKYSDFVKGPVRV